jgi:hypothetical protein
MIAAALAWPAIVRAVDGESPARCAGWIADGAADR